VISYSYVIEIIKTISDNS